MVQAAVHLREVSGRNAPDPWVDDPGVMLAGGRMTHFDGGRGAWTANHHPADWREQQQRWDRLHYARVAIIAAGFVLTLLAGTIA